MIVTFRLLKFLLLFIKLSIIIIICMSALIEAEFQDQESKSSLFCRKKTPSDQHYKTKRVLSTLIQEMEEGFKTSKISVEKKPDTFKAFIQAPPFCLNYSFMSSIIYRNSQSSLQYSNVLLNAGNIFSLPTKNLRLSAIHFITQIHQQFPNLIIVIDSENGKMIIKNKIFLDNEIIAKDNNLREILISQINSNKQKIIKLLRQISNNKQMKYFHPQDYERNNKELINKTIKYLKLSFLELDISNVQQQKRKFLQKHELNQRDRFHNNKLSNINDLQLAQNISLFQCVDESAYRYQEFTLSQQEIKDMGPYLTFPKPRILNQSQNQFIFNEVTVKNLNQLSTFPSNLKGGNSEIFLIKIKFQYNLTLKPKPLKYPLSVSVSSHIQPRQIERVVALKTPLNKQSQKYITHELQILNVLKFTSSAYLIKYYKTQQACQLKNKLMMDFLPNAVDLYSHISNNKQILSMTSKLIILSNIANGLRFLRNHRIVHMDLSLKNILVSGGLLTKIIDFGQAYCERVCGKQYNPGFTNPFGPPEVFKGKHFTTKQDVFSYGIILYKLLFEQFPFQPTQKLKIAYMMKNYHQRHFLAYQSIDYTWQQQPMLLLVSLIERCKSCDSQTRPYPTWIRVIIKLIIKWYRRKIQSF